MRLKKRFKCVFQCGNKSEYEFFPCRLCVLKKGWSLCIRCHSWFWLYEYAKQIDKNLISHKMLCPGCGNYKYHSKNGYVNERHYIPVGRQDMSYRLMRYHIKRLRVLMQKNQVENKGTKGL